MVAEVVSEKESEEKALAHAPTTRVVGRPFPKGHKLAKGNPAGGRIEKLRHALVRAVTREDVDAIAKALVREAKKGDVNCAKEVFNRLFGKAVQPVLVDGDKGVAKVQILQVLADPATLAMAQELARRMAREEPNGSPHPNAADATQAPPAQGFTHETGEGA